MSFRIAVAANSAWNILTFRQGLIRALKAEGYDPIVISPADPGDDARMDILGVDRIAVPLDRSGLDPIADLKLLLRYRRILKSIGADFFLGFTIKPNIYGCIASRWLGIPALPNISGLGTVFLMDGPLRILVTAMYRFALKGCDVVFFQNPDDLELSVEHRIIRRSQGRLVPGSGIDLDRFKPEPAPSGAPKFLLIARLLRDKGVPEYVQAARTLRARYPDVRFQLLGPVDTGNRTAVQQSELDAWIAEDVIDYFGTTDDVRPIIANASVVVLPSYREGLPHALLEGAAMARPLITTDVPGCREVVEHGVNGFLCEARSANSLADSLEAMIRSTEEERSRMGAASRTLVEERFSEERVVKAYVDALKSFARAS